ncbi:MAG: DUF5698 domain-containing protein [Bacilli bacterium]
MALALLAAKIFFVRILDVSMGTVRMILLVKGRKVIASLVGFVEIAIWFAVVKEAINTDVTSIWIIIAYSGGFAIGTLIGSILSEKFIKGSLNVQIITTKNDKVADALRENGYAVSVLDIKGKDDTKPKYMLIMEVDKNHFNHLRTLIKDLDSKAFIVVNETKFVQNGYFRDAIK